MQQLSLNASRAVFMAAYTRLFMELMSQVIYSFKSYYLRKTFPKVIAAIVIPLMGMSKVNKNLL